MRTYDPPEKMKNIATVKTIDASSLYEKWSNAFFPSHAASRPIPTQRKTIIRSLKENGRGTDSSPSPAGNHASLKRAAASSRASSETTEAPSAWIASSSFKRASSCAAASSSSACFLATFVLIASTPFAPSLARL